VVGRSWVLKINKYKMNFKDTFLKLTEYTVPFGYEDTLESLLPNGFKKDEVGNYYYVIGESKTLFTTHLDTASKDRVKINHIIDNNIIKTDGSSILGGDNKAGCCVLFYLIENKIPGTYYFFLGEESTVHKNLPYGSLMALENNPDRFKFNRSISFDRKEKGQMVVRQIAKNCASTEFADALIFEYKNLGVEYEKDKTGYYTDNAFFSDIIPECVNLSVGVWNEHTKNEYVDISYTEKVAKASAKIDWENLPTLRNLDKKYQIDKRKDLDEIKDHTKDQLLFESVFVLLDDLYFVCHEIRSYTNYLNQFVSGRIYHFTKWHEDEDMEISVSNGIIIANGKEFKSFDEFKKSMGVEKLSIDEFSKLMLDEFSKNNNILPDAKFYYLVSLKGADVGKLSRYFGKRGIILTKIGKGYSISKKENKSYLKKSYSSFRKK
jgi:hypothetical protein